MNDKEFLQWIHERLQRYGENPKQDFMVRLGSIVTAECLKNEAVAEALAREAKLKKLQDMRNQIAEIEAQIEEMNPYESEGLMLGAISRLQTDVYDEIRLRNG